MPTDPTTQLEIFGPVFEQSTAIYRALLVDEKSIPIPTLNSLAMTLFDKETETIINHRRIQDILGHNGGAFTAGQLELTLSASDNMIMDESKSDEDHIMRLDYTYNSGTVSGHDAVIIRVRNLRKLS